MSTASWTHDLATGHAGIDADHREIIAIAHRLVHDPSAHESLGGALALLKYMEIHVTKRFSAEQELMVRHDYPQMPEHMTEHGRLTGYITSLCREVRNDNVDVDTLSVSNRLLCNWIVRHITVHDRKLAEFLRALPPDQAVKATAHARPKQVLKPLRAEPSGRSPARRS